ncbi:RNA-directed DNA polymerase [Tanacetum coccineum]
MKNGHLRIALECSNEHEASRDKSILDMPLWTMYCNGKKVGFAFKRKPSFTDINVLKHMETVNVGAGIIKGKDIQREDDIMYLRGNFEKGIRVGNGTSTQFWNDTWTGDAQLRHMFPRIYALEGNKICTVADKLQSSVALSLRHYGLNLNGEGVFRVKDARMLLDERFLPKDSTATRWVKSIPIKINVFAWKVYLDRLPTRLNLMKRGVLVPSLLCPVCNADHEDTSHLLVSCSLANEAVRLVCRWWNLTWSPLGSYSDWLSWFNSSRLCSRTKGLLEGVFYVTCGCHDSGGNRLTKTSLITYLHDRHCNGDAQIITKQSLTTSLAIFEAAEVTFKRMGLWLCGVCFKTHTLRSMYRHGEGSNFVSPPIVVTVRLGLCYMTSLSHKSLFSVLHDHVDELMPDEHVGFTLPILDKLLSKGLRTVKSIPPKCRLGFSRVLKGALDKVICTPDDISFLDMIKSFPRGTSYGRDGLRAQHLMDCLSGAVVAISAWNLDDGTIIGDTLVVRVVLKNPRSRFVGVFPPNIARPLHGVKLLGGPASANFDFSSELVKRVSKSIMLLGQAQRSFDAALRSSLERLGVYSTSDVLNYAFIASRLQSAGLQSKLLRDSNIVTFGPAFDNALSTFNSKMEIDLLSNPSESQIEEHTSDWLKVVPISGLGQTMNGDIYGDHAVSCTRIVGIKHQHNIVRDTLVDICFRSEISAGKEVDIGLGGGRDKLLRSADMLLYSWDGGLYVCVDLAGSSPLTQTGMIDFLPGRVVTEDAQRKRVKYEAKCAEIGYWFLPFSFSSFGELEKDVVTLLKRIQKFSMT